MNQPNYKPIRVRQPHSKNQYVLIHTEKAHNHQLAFKKPESPKQMKFFMASITHGAISDGSTIYLINQNVSIHTQKNFYNHEFIYDENYRSK